jgi:diguanylate cyclase (GGDEF)-like protein
LTGETVAENSPESATPREKDLIRRPEFIYSAALFALAATIVSILIARAGGVLTDHSPLIALFFVLYGWFTITAGYEHPRIGYVSFDRISQVASILVLGPLDAAWINGLASFIFPWWRLRSGAPFSRVLTASLNNSGLMALMVLACGSLYASLGGQIPLTTIEWEAVLLLPLLILSMQIVNDGLMMVFGRLRDGGWRVDLNRFVFAMESGAATTAVVVAVVFNRMEPVVTVLLLLVLSTGMLVLRQFAHMRVQLESIVDERTRGLREKTVELELLASRDQLTGLFNRRYADTHLERCIEDFHRYGRGFAVALIDLDHFKRINDQQSHEVGDQVLKRVARILMARCRRTDVVARYGGEEFLLCFAETDAVTVTDICEQLRHAVAGADWSSISPDIKVSLSAGVAEMRAGLGRSDLVNAADRKLYEAKDAGRNLVK